LAGRKVHFVRGERAGRLPKQREGCFHDEKKGDAAAGGGKRGENSCIWEGRKEKKEKRKLLRRFGEKLESESEARKGEKRRLSFRGHLRRGEKRGKNSEVWGTNLR